MRKYIVFPLVLLVCLCKAYTQDSTQLYTFKYPKIRLGFSPSAFVHYLPAAQISGDVGVHNGRINLGVETGYIFRGNNRILSPDRPISEAKGIVTRFSLDYAVSRWQEGCFYMGIAHLYKYSKQNLSKSFRGPDDNAVERTVHDERRYSGGLLQTGVLSYLGYGIYLDFNLGAGFGMLKTKQFDDGVHINSGKEPLPIIFFNFNFSHDLGTANSRKKNK